MIFETQCNYSTSLQLHNIWYMIITHNSLRSYSAKNVTSYTRVSWELYCLKSVTAWQHQPAFNDNIQEPYWTHGSILTLSANKLCDIQ